MVCGSLLAAVSYAIALLYLARGRKRYLVLILLLFLATFGNPEMLFLSYSFLLVVCVLRQVESDHRNKAAALSWRQALAVVPMLSALGLTPLVKGSLLLPYLASVAIPTAFLLYRARFRDALLWLLIPVTATLTFWVLAGQSLAGFPGYLRGTILIISGYTEAMSTTEMILPGAIASGSVIVFLAISASILLLVGRTTQLTSASKWTLIVLCAVFLLVVFKHCVIKVDNLPDAFSTPFVLIVIIGFLFMDRYLVWLLSIVMVLAVVASVRNDRVLFKAVHDKFGRGVTWGGSKRPDILAFCLKQAAGAYTRTTYKRTWETYSGAWDGLRSRVSGGNVLADRFEKAKADIRSGDPVPALMGTVDVYTYDQSAILASNDKWDPRPVILSLNAYTPALARINEQHLRGPDAPDWVLFDLSTMFAHLPSLDDGMSWPALFDNYTFISYDGRFALLRKNKVIHASSNYDHISTGTYETGETVPVPKMDGLMFAEVDLKPTLLGWIQSQLFRPPQLYITLHFGDGEIKKYRVISNEMVTGFLVSPFVSNTSEFVPLMSSNKGTEDGRKVESISIAPTYGGSVLWSGTYELKFKRYVGQ
jgi:hypothetical protein